MQLKWRRRDRGKRAEPKSGRSPAVAGPTVRCRGWDKVGVCPPAPLGGGRGGGGGEPRYPNSNLLLHRVSQDGTGVRSALRSTEEVSTEAHVQS